MVAFGGATVLRERIEAPPLPSFLPGCDIALPGPDLTGAQDHAALPVLLRDLAGTILAWNAGCESLFGIAAGDALGRDAHGLLGTVFPLPRAAIEAALRRDGCWSGEVRHHLPDGRRLAVAAHWELRRAAAGVAPDRVAETCIDLTATREAESRAESRLALAQTAAGIGAWELDLGTGRLWLDLAGRALHGLPPGPEAEIGFGDFLALLHPEDRQAAEAGLRRAAAHGTPCRLRLRYRIQAAAGAAPRWVESRGGRPEGAPWPESGRCLGISLDVTARQAEEEGVALRMREVEHRSRNTLATVQALLRLTRAETPEGYARALEGRIAALGRAQALLVAGTRPELRALLEAEFLPYLGSATDRLVLSGPGLALAPEAVQPLSMAVHELVTNAAKHGALSCPGGRVAVEWAITAEGWLRLEWQETGGPPLARPPSRTGFGSGLLRSLARVQLGGSLDKTWEAAGLRCRIMLPPQAREPG
jgi:two-component sensor histidine kinase